MSTEGGKGKLPYSESLKEDISKMRELDKLYKGEGDRAKQVINHSIKKLEEYRKAKQAILPDSDGIYIIVKGESKVVNSFD